MEMFYCYQDMRQVCEYEHAVGPVVLDPSMVVHSGLYFSISQPHTVSPAYAAIYEMKSHLITRLMEIHLGRELMIQVICVSSAFRKIVSVLYYCVTRVQSLSLCTFQHMFSGQSCVELHKEMDLQPISKQSTTY